MTHKEIVEVLIGLMSALFVAIVSTTIVSTALPTIIADLEGTQTQYTWVVTASLLAMTVTSPIWSKLSDLFNKKLLVQIAIVVFLVGSLAAGAVQNVPELLAARAVQGLGMGGLIALAQSIIGSIIPPRERGRYSGYMAATMAVATVSGPLLGGLLVDTARLALVLLGGRPVRRRRPGDAAEVPARRDHPSRGAHRLLGRAVHHRRREPAADLGLLRRQQLRLVVGRRRPSSSAPRWSRWSRAIVVERRHSDPLVPPRIVADRITMLSILGSLAVGVAQFGASVFLSQYFQVARDHTPDRGRPADAAADRRQHGRRHGHRAVHHPHRSLEGHHARRRRRARRSACA